MDGRSKRIKKHADSNENVFTNSVDGASEVLVACTRVTRDVNSFVSIFKFI